MRPSPATSHEAPAGGPPCSCALGCSAKNTACEKVPSAQAGLRFGGCAKEPVPLIPARDGIGGCRRMTDKACVDYAQYYRAMANEARTAEAWRLYKQLADLWERAGSDRSGDEAESKRSSETRPGRH